jgi:hypothetical protein
MDMIVSLWLGVALAQDDCVPAPLVVAAVPGEESRGDCLFVDLQAAGKAYVSFPDTGVSRGVALSRARAELGARAHDVSARLVVGAVRSSGEDGYMGINGEAYVPEVRVAEARVDLAGLGLALAGGLVDDSYVMTVQPAWGRRDLLAPLATDQGYLDRADVGGWLGWTAPGGLLSATVAVTTGEGYTRRERNDGVNLTGVVHVRPAQSQEEGAVTPELVVLAREGSRGLSSAPDHRVGGAALLHQRYLVAGAELIVGWGLQGDATRHPLGFSAWARTADALPLAGVLRADVARDERSATASEEVLLLAAAGPRLPWNGPNAPLVLMVGYEGRKIGPKARPLAGSPALASSDTIFLTLSATVRGGVPFSPR